MRMVIEQVAYKHPGDEEGNRFYQDVFHGESVEALLEELYDKFDIRPPKRPKGVFIDTKSQGAVQVGFLARRWREGAVGDKNYWEENWITFMSDDRQIVPLPKQLRASI